MNYLELLKLAMPETIVVLTALAVLTSDLVAMRDLELRFRMVIGGMISIVGCLVAIGWMLVLPQHSDVSGGIFVVDPLNTLVKIALLALTVLTVLISLDSKFSVHAGEYFDV